MTASAGVVAVIGGPLPTGRRRAIDQVIRTTAPMHDGFSGGAFLDTEGALARPHHGRRDSRSWRRDSRRHRVEDGGARAGTRRLGERGYLGIVGQPVRLPETQAAASGRDAALLVANLAPGGPAEAAGVLIGDLLVALDDTPVTSPEDLLDLLTGARVGHSATLHLVRGGSPAEVTGDDRRAAGGIAAACSPAPGSGYGLRHDRLRKAFLSQA